MNIHTVAYVENMDVEEIVDAQIVEIIHVPVIVIYVEHTTEMDVHTVDYAENMDVEVIIVEAMVVDIKE